MRKLAQYRRNAAPNSGFKERAVWQLSKGPKTGRELSALFHMSLGQFNSIMRGCLRGETAVITASNPGGAARESDHHQLIFRIYTNHRVKEL